MHRVRSGAALWCVSHSKCSSMNKTKGHTQHGTGTSCSPAQSPDDGTRWEVWCERFATSSIPGISRARIRSPGYSVICPALCSSLLCKLFFVGDRIGKTGHSSSAVLTINQSLFSGSPDNKAGELLKTSQIIAGGPRS